MRTPRAHTGGALSRSRLARLGVALAAVAATFLGGPATAQTDHPAVPLLLEAGFKVCATDALDFKGRVEAFRRASFTVLETPEIESDGRRREISLAAVSETDRRLISDGQALVATVLLPTYRNQSEFLEAAAKARTVALERDTTKMRAGDKFAYLSHPIGGILAFVIESETVRDTNSQGSSICVVTSAYDHRPIAFETFIEANPVWRRSVPQGTEYKMRRGFDAAMEGEYNREHGAQIWRIGVAGPGLSRSTKLTPPMAARLTISVTRNFRREKNG